MLNLQNCYLLEFLTFAPALSILIFMYKIVLNCMLLYQTCKNFPSFQGHIENEEKKCFRI